MSKRKFGVLLLLLSTALTGHADDGAKSEAQLEKLYQQFFRQRDETGLLTLVYWRGVTKQDRDSFRRSVRDDFKYHLRDIHFLSLQPHEDLEYTLKGVKYVPALPPVGRMIVRYKDQENVRNHSTLYLVGAKEGRYYIDLAVKLH